ncbi:MAG: hypothetical protein ACR2PL_10770 [Dehalococcoidia bacterium]
MKWSEFTVPVSPDAHRLLMLARHPLALAVDWLSEAACLLD